MFDRRKPSFDLAELVGHSASEAKDRCEAAGFKVQVIDLDRTNAITLDYNPERIRLMIRYGKVTETRQS